MDSDTDDDKTKSAFRSAQYNCFKNTALIDPDERIKILAHRGTAVDIDPNIPPLRYYRSGVELIRMANVYIEEGTLENAYVLYMKFMTLFLEKIRTHPQYNAVSLKERNANQQKLREILPKAEALKAQLLTQYKLEQVKYLEDVKTREKIEIERLRREEEQRSKDEEENKRKLAAQATSRVISDKPYANIAGIDDELSKATNETPTRTTSPIPQKPDNLIKEVKDKDTPTVDRSTKPILPDTHDLRTIVLPNKTMAEFLILASTNTMHNRETCGVLAGKLERNKLLVTHLLIPQQTGSADSCITHNEENIFDYQDQHNLITVGWIHTHPTQTAFLSSVDLHTHCSYQLMMPEAIAVVCAPKYQDTGFYTLTPEYGLNFIAKCRTTGFHPHPTQPPLYRTANHCKLDPMTSIQVVDLRK